MMEKDRVTSTEISGGQIPATADEPASARRDATDRESRVPRELAIAMLCLGMIVILNVANVIFDFVLGRIGWLSSIPLLSGGVVAIVMYGVFHHHRLAWNWGLVIGLGGAILNGMIAVGAGLAASQVLWERGPTGESLNEFSRAGISLLVGGSLSGIAAVLQAIICFCFNSAPARIFFDAVCPNCNRSSVTGNDFLFTKAICDYCHHVW